MRIFIVSLAIMASIPAVAFSGSWTEVGRDEKTAANETEFKALQQAYPNFFSSVDPTMVKSASVTIRHSHYVGATRCAPNDARLNRDFYSAQVCTNDGTCQGETEMIPNSDPCK